MASAKITITFPDSGETKIAISKAWKEDLSNVAKLDCLKDALYDLSNLYDETRKAWRNEMAALRRKAKKK